MRLATAVPLAAGGLVPAARAADIVAALDIDEVTVDRDRAIVTPPRTKDFDRHAGVYLWRLTAEPRKTEAVRHHTR